MHHARVHGVPLRDCSLKHRSQLRFIIVVIVAIVAIIAPLTLAGAIAINVWRLR